MPSITLEQSLFHRPERDTPQLLGRSPGFQDAWLAEAERLMLGFGDRKNGVSCPLTVFAKPLTAKHVAIVRVKDDKPGPFPGGLRFHFLVVDKKSYVAFIRDPFIFAAKIEPVWEGPSSLPSPTIAEEAFAPRTVAQVQEVLKRIKAAALREGEDPEAPDFERTIENSESPALLGGTQVLVDGGRLIFERPEGDLRMVSGLWLLLPEATRCRLWPTSFAFSGELEFDVLVVPQLENVILENYTTEDQASGYPDGSYEIALQHAVESGNQNDLDAVFSKRDGHQTIRLALTLLLLVSSLVLFSRWLDNYATNTSANSLQVQQQKIVAATGIVAVGDPWTASAMLLYGERLWQPKK